MRTRPIVKIAFMGVPIAALSVYLGFVFDHPFLGNLLAEIAGIVIGALIGIFLLDRFIQQDREAQWSKSRNYLLSGIAGHLSDAATDLFIFIPIGDHRPMTAVIDGRTHPTPNAIQALKDVAQQMRAVRRSPSPDKHLSDYAIEWYEHAKWDLDQIQTVLTPRVVQSEAEQELIDALLEFDQIRRSLHSAIISHKLTVTDAAYRALIDLVNAFATLYTVICKYWRPVARITE